MKVFKTFLSFSVPLIAMLLSYSIYIALDKAVTAYKQSIINDYSIVIVSKNSLTNSSIGDLDIDMNKLVLLQNSKIVNNLKEKLSNRSIELLKEKLPFFYKLYLNNFPTSNQLKEIKQKLLSKNSITKVEIFSKNHDQIYSILLMTQNIIYVLFGIVILFSLIILSKHIQIWFYEHHERISIMRLHGASTIYCAMPLINVAILSALFSSTIVIGITYYLLTTIDFAIPVAFNLDFIKVAALSFTISLGTVIAVLFKHKFND